MEEALKQIFSELKDLKSGQSEIIVRLDNVDKRLDGVDKRLDGMQSDIEQIKEDVAVTREATNSLVEWADEAAQVVGVRFPVRKER